MKTFIVLIVLSFLAGVACSPNNKGQRPGVPAEKGGGVDVGNMNEDSQQPAMLKTARVPGTEVMITYPDNWESSDRNQTLNLSNGKGSSVTAQKVDVDLVSPTPQTLKIHLASKYPSKRIQEYRSAGLSGVRVQGASTQTEKQEDIYLISPLGKVVGLSSRLVAEENGFKEGEEIVTSARVKYLGKSYDNEPVRTVTLKEYYQTTEASDYSLLDNCFPRQQPGCGQASVHYKNLSQVDMLQIGDGRIIELGSDEEVSFEDVRVEGEYLVSSRQIKTPLSDIYTEFDRNNPQVMREEMAIEVGMVYLIRSQNWPYEDFIVKLRVESLDVGKAVTVSYQKLTYIEQEVLQRQVDQLNQYTLEVEQPRTTGEVILFNRHLWESYYNSGFNFEYSSSGNKFIVRNRWHVRYERYGTLVSSNSSRGDSYVFDLGEKPLEQVTVEDFPNFNVHQDKFHSLVPQLHHTYLISNLDHDGKQIMGAVKVLEIHPKRHWIRLEFRRIQVSQLEEFQDWQPLPVPPGLRSFDIEVTGQNSSTIFHIFGERREHVEDIHFRALGDNTWGTSVSARPYEGLNGFAKWEGEEQLGEFRAAHFEEASLEFENRLKNLSRGDVVLLRHISIFKKYLVAFKVLSLSDHKLTIEVQYIELSEAPFLHWEGQTERVPPLDPHLQQPENLSGPPPSLPPSKVTWPSLCPVEESSEDRTKGTDKEDLRRPPTQLELCND